MDELQYKIWLFEDGEENTAIIFMCSAYNEHEALEKAENSHPNCTFICAERLEYPSFY